MKLPTMDSLFGSKGRTFWVFQCVGWLGYGLVRMFHGMTVGQDMSDYYRLIIFAAVIGILITTLMRGIFRMFINSNLHALLVLSVIVSGFFGLLFSSIETTMAPYLVAGFDPPKGIARFGNAMFEATVLFAWTSLYYGYHLYTGIQEQREQTLKATAMAHQAQLKMLRYQLNPHFLFNTLNAISTLVLDKSVSEANQMLTKLSSFLRYTLVDQPTQRVTLDQELRSLSLYLDIERVRFGERLQIDYDVEERVKNALVPSLLMQPLVENAIKYAIAPAIDGGIISVRAYEDHNKLVLIMQDTGPGIADLTNIVSQSGSGVGIVNTRERLSQIYGNRHQFVMENIEPTGLRITVKIPCERERRAA